MSVILENINYTYSPGTPFEHKALDNVSLKIATGSFTGLIGHTGSGKSTLIQHLNALVKPDSGKITINGTDITADGVSLSDVRKKVGLVFQYPEYQIFEETIAEDIAFGPTKLNLSKEEINERVREAMEMVGLNYEEKKDKSPFDMSGGQKRRVAIAGILAMRPEVLILDEPTAGLDPGGREEILKEIDAIHKRTHNTVIWVSHSMDDVSRFVDNLIVMNKGKIEFVGKPSAIFQHEKRMTKIGLGVPKAVELANILNDKGWHIPHDVLTIEDILPYIISEREKTRA